MMNQKGRSMVEMLGVLAIIGVLSVGGIAGYQKAIFKHRLTIHTQGIDSLLRNALEIRSKLDKSEYKSTRITEILKKLSDIPNGFTYLDSGKISDNFANIISIYHQQGNDGVDYWGLSFTFSENSKDGATLCQNIATIAKEYSDQLWMLKTYKFYNDTPSSTVPAQLYGGKGCRYKCIQTMELKEKEALCNTCDEKPCIIYILWR